MNHWKRRVRAVMAKYPRMTWQAAVNALQRERASSSSTADVAPKNAGVEAALRNHCSPHVSSILLVELPTRDHEKPRYVARSGGEGEVSDDEYLELIALGATLAGRVQVIALEPMREQGGRSVLCAGCSRWIWCGLEPRSGACVCGQAFEFRFVDGDVAQPIVGARCMECGVRSENAEQGADQLAAFLPPLSLLANLSGHPQ